VSHPGYILVSWALVLLSVGGYSLRLLVRGRALSRLVPEDRRRWMTTEDPL
jgi:hypothetical protein